MSPAIPPTSASESTSSSTSLSSLSTHRRMQKFQRFQRFQRFPSPEQRTRKDLVISALLGILSLCAVGGIWWNSDARITEHRINSKGVCYYVKKEVRFRATATIF